MSDTILSAARASEIAKKKLQPELELFMKRVLQEAEKGHRSLFASGGEIRDIKQNLEELGYTVEHLGNSQFAVIW